MAGKLQPDEALIRKLAKLLEQEGLTEIEYEADGRRVRVARGTATTMIPAVQAAPIAEATAAAGGRPADEAVPASAVTAPMVGTVYLSPEPGAAAFVKVGDTVHDGQTLLIIEAMKVMNPLVAPRGGTVTRILVQDGQPVEFAEPLLLLE
ncbi:MAG: acetyl-CoA carboxylase biotin carboxyl carrier protein [Kiloniellales bacterium]